MARIRAAEAGDILCIVDMVEDLRLAVEGPIPVDRAWTAQTLAKLITGPDAIVLISDGGFIAGSLQPTVINPRQIAMEHGWYSADRSGLALLRAFEAWAASRGAILVQLSTGAEGLDLSRLGYRLVERAWIK